MTRSLWVSVSYVCNCGRHGTVTGMKNPTVQLKLSLQGVMYLHHPKVTSAQCLECHSKEICQSAG